MTRFKKIPQIKNEGKVSFSADVLDGIVLLAMREVEDVELVNPSISSLNSSAIKIKRNGNNVYIDVAVKIHFTQSISEAAFKIQEAIRHNIEAMTDYHVDAVNVIVKDVGFSDKVLTNQAPEQQEENQEEN